MPTFIPASGGSGAAAPATAKALPGGFGWYPEIPLLFSGIASNGGVSISAGTHRKAAIGRVRWSDGAAHDVAEVHLRLGAITSAGGSNVRISLQDLAAASGPPPYPDGTQDVYKDTLASAFTASAWNSSGSLTSDGTGVTGTRKNVAHGQHLAVVLEFQAFAGADSVEWRGISLDRPFGGGMMEASTDSGTTWALDGWRCPELYFKSTDATPVYGTFENAMVENQNVGWSSASNPNEYVQRIRFPTKVSIDGYFWHGTMGGASGSMVVRLLTGAAASPAVVADSSVTIDGHHDPDTSGRLQLVTLPAAITLDADTDYWISFVPNATTAYLAYQVAEDANFWAGTPWKGMPRGSRNGGAITEDSTYRAIAGVRVSAIWS